MVLNTEIRKQILGENYLIYKMYIKYFTLNPRLKRDDTPAYFDIFKLCKENIILSNSNKELPI